MTSSKHERVGSRARVRSSKPKKLDLAQFISVDDAVSKIEPGDRYVDIGRRLNLIGQTGAIDRHMLVFFWLSMLSRSEGLHQAIAREVKQSNPVAVFPLIRAFAEAVVLVMYVEDHPDYIEALTRRPSERNIHARKRKSIQSLIAAVSDQAPGMKAVYSELSEITHFGAIAMWTAHSADEVLGADGSPILKTTWTSSPRWRSDEQALIACAQTLELADAMVAALSRFARRHVVPLWPFGQCNVAPPSGLGAETVRTH